MERLAKYIARRGVCSRREAERLIVAKQVQVNAKVIEKCATLVNDHDTIHVRGAILPKIEPACKIWLYHKPIGLITSHNDPQKRPTVFDQIKKQCDYSGQIISVGRLDIETEGLMVLTNNGALARTMELPSSRILRCYYAYVKEDVSSIIIKKSIKSPEGIPYAMEEVGILSNNCIKISLREGKKREVRNIMKAMNLNITRLIRISYGPFFLGDIKQGCIEEVNVSQIGAFFNTLSFSI